MQSAIGGSGEIHTVLKLDRDGFVGAFHEESKLVVSSCLRGTSLEVGGSAWRSISAGAQGVRLT